MMDHMTLKHTNLLGKEGLNKHTKPTFSGLLTRPTKDSFQSLQPLFRGTLDVNRPPTISGSRWVNDLVKVDRSDLMGGLITRLDEVMTTTGEAYAVTPERKAEKKRSEAFTTLMEVNFLPNAQKEPVAPGKMNITTTAQVEATRKASMVLYAEAINRETQEPLATARASFMAIDAESFTDPHRKMEVSEVRPLEVADSSTDKELNETATSWNTELLGFYKPIGKRLGNPETTHPDLQTLHSPVRMINENDYVTPGQLNKKHSGHGGVTAGIAMANMEELAHNYLKEADFPHQGVQLEALTANFAQPYSESDALQLDTTLDHMDEKGRMFISTRVSRHDTQGGKIEGPVFMFHAVLTHQPDNSLLGRLKTDPPFPTLDPQYFQTDEAQLRQTEAKQWAQLQGMTEG